MKISDKVVCVDDSPRPDIEWKFPPSAWVVKGEVYTVSEVVAVDDDGNLGLRLSGIFGGVEFRNPDIENAWREGRFRLLSEIQAENRSSKKVKEGAL